MFLIKITMNKLGKILIGADSTIAAVGVATNLFGYFGEKDELKEQEGYKERKDVRESAREDVEFFGEFPQNIIFYGARIAAKHYLENNPEATDNTN